MIKSIKFCCYFASPKRNSIKINTYTDAIYKTLSVFDDTQLKEEVDDYSKNIDINDGFEYAQERYKDLLWSRKQVLNIATIGLYHLWEKAIRDILINGLQSFTNTIGQEQKNNKKTYDMILRASFVTLKDALSSCEELTNSLETIAELSQVVNVLKHGEGNSFYHLLKDYPSLINNDSIHINDKLEISIEKFRQYHYALNEFWSNLPEYMWIQLKNKPKE